LACIQAQGGDKWKKNGDGSGSIVQKKPKVLLSIGDDKICNVPEECDGILSEKDVQHPLATLGKIIRTGPAKCQYKRDKEKEKRRGKEMIKNWINPSEHMRERLRVWANKEGIDIDKKDYIVGNPEKAIDKNIFGGLDTRSREELGAGKGNELKGKRGEMPKMAALHSSSALVCNFFQHWRRPPGNCDIITQALGFDRGYDDLQFERTYKINKIRGIPPHLDVEITGKNMIPLAIESKFLEPYDKKDKNKIPFKEAYFIVKDKDIWDRYEKCKDLAREMNDNRKLFRYFDAPQILKHMLGLESSYGKHKFILICLWYKIDSLEANEHVREINVFKERITSEFDFRDMTYQDLFEKVKKLSGNNHKKYIEYLEKRYFNESIL
jgi:hypothetical protein